MKFCIFISLHSQSKYKISHLFAEAIQVWRCKPQISQGHLGGRDGSNSCTLIAIIPGRMFCLSESELAIPNQNSNPLKNSWVHALANAIVDGNTVYDKNILNQQIPPACYLMLKQLAHSLGNSLKLLQLMNLCLFGFKIQMIHH